MKNQHGAAASVAIITALIVAIGAYALLVVAVSQAKQGSFHRFRMRAQYAAEAGLVRAQQQLMADPTTTFPLDPDFTIDGFGVDIIATSCSPGPCTLQAKVTY